MKYIINYTNEGRILGFINKESSNDLNIEVDNQTWFNYQGMNKIIIDGKNITFENVDWRTPEEIEESRVQNINSYTQSIITGKYPLEKQSSANLGIYREEYKTEMISFISNCITLSNEAIDNGTSFEDYKAMLNEY